MAFNIRMGLPEMEAFWKDLSTRKQQGKLDKDQEKFFKKLVKVLAFLSQNPRHPGLASHEIDDLTRKYRMKIFQSYLARARRTPFLVYRSSTAILARVRMVFSLRPSS